MSPRTVTRATPQHPACCTEEKPPGKGWRSLGAVTTLEPVISRTRMLSPCRLPPQKPAVPGQTEQGWRQSRGHIYFQDLCWRAGDGAGTGWTELILKIHTPAVPGLVPGWFGALSASGEPAHPYPIRCLVATVLSPRSLPAPGCDHPPSPLLPPAPRNRSLLVSGWLEPAEAKQMPGNMPGPARLPWSWPLAVPAHRPWSPPSNPKIPPRACDLHPPSTISGSGVLARV